MIWALATIGLLYGMLIAALAFGMQKLPPFEPISQEPDHDFSVLVVFRDEEGNLGKLIEHIRKLDYPREKFEILLIDDDSGDGSLDLLTSLSKEHPELNIRILEFVASSNAPKKEALEMGVQKAAFDWIITTDADCAFGPDFLKAYDQFLQLYPAKLVAGPVICVAEDSFLNNFQSLDFLSLQGSTMGGFGGKEKVPFLKPFMCNGANLCYEKKTFLELSAYSGNREIASGDDVFLLEKMLQHHASEVLFVKSRSALVRTGPKATWKGLIAQRKRWAAKTSSYQNRFAQFVGMLVFLANLSLILGLGLALFGSLSWFHLGTLFLIKINVDFILIYNTASFLDQTQVMKSFVMSSLIYPFFTVWVALLSLNGNYEWKGRSFKK